MMVAGYVNGRTGRLPTVLVRPGRGNMAATVCYSALVRELLQVHPISPLIIISHVTTYYCPCLHTQYWSHVVRV